MPATPSGLDAAGASPALSQPSAPGVPAAAQSGNAHVCPDCGTPRSTPTATFCEVCRYNFITQTSWSTPKVTNQPAPAGASSISAPLPVALSGGSAGIGSTATPSTASSPAATFSTATPADFQTADASLASAVDGSVAGASTLPAVPVGSLDNGVSKRVLPPDTAGSSQEGLTLAPITRWEARLTVDPSLNVDPDPALPCPVGEPERVFPLDFPDNLIGRRSEKRGIFPEINVNDPCASHRHAKIQRQADGSFALLDVGSTNGTQLNGTEVQPNVLTPLKDGDQITLGCWSRITIQGLRS